MRRWLVLGFGICLALRAEADFVVPESRGWVNDYAGALSAEEAARIAAASKELETSTSAELVLVVVRSTEGTPPDEAAHAILSRWGVGKKSKGNGIVLLLALEDQHIELAVGPGLDEAFPPPVAKALLEDAAIPWLKQEKPGDALLAVVDRCALRLRALSEIGAPAVAKEPTPGTVDNHVPPPQSEDATRLLLSSTVIGLLVFWVPWYWMHRILQRLKRQNPCPHCGTRLQVMETVLVPSTRESVGQAERVSRCLACGYQATSSVALAVLAMDSPGGSGAAGTGS